MPSHSAAEHHAHRRRRRRLVLGGLALVLVVLALLAVPVLLAVQDARAARTDLTAALDALRTGNLPAARTAVARARQNIDEADDGTHGIGGDVWSSIPVVGTPVSDARHLVEALDDATAVAEVGVELYPSVAGERATLFRDQQVDRKTLDAVTAGVGEAHEHLVSADEALDQVEGTTPVVGDTIAAQRDAAAARVTPALDTADGLVPLMDALPGVLGFEGERSYLIALLNPAELRYSGGAALSFAPMTWDDGKVVLEALGRARRRPPAERSETPGTRSAATTSTGPAPGWPTPPSPRRGRCPARSCSGRGPARGSRSTTGCWPSTSWRCPSCSARPAA